MGDFGHPRMELKMRGLGLLPRFTTILRILTTSPLHHDVIVEKGIPFNTRGNHWSIAIGKGYDK
jgi:hypothetical protein